jgi:hypothetical protein
MGRAANELGYHPRALLVRQLSRIACDIPHFSYLHYVVRNYKKIFMKQNLFFLLLLMSCFTSNAQTIKILSNDTIYSCKIIGTEPLRHTPHLDLNDKLIITESNAVLVMYDYISNGTNSFFKVIYKGMDLYLRSVNMYCKNDSIINLWMSNQTEQSILRRKENAINYDKLLSFELNNKKIKDSLFLANIKRLNDSLDNEAIIRQREDSIASNKREYENYYNLLKNGIGLSDFRVYDNDNSVGFSINFTNMHKLKKVIKYIYITITAINPVGDIVGIPKKFTCVGPIKYEETSSIKFENAFYSKIIETLEITNIKVEYMDKTTVIYNSKMIEKIILNE